MKSSASAWRKRCKLVPRRLPDGAVEAIGAGVFLTGGTSLMRGFSELAFDVFGRDIYRPEPPEISGVASELQGPPLRHRHRPRSATPRFWKPNAPARPA